MAKYELRFKKSVRKDLAAIPSDDVSRILKAFEFLSDTPRGPVSVKLSTQARYRYRVGRYRILYEIADEILIVTVVKVAHRREVYR